MWATRKNPGFTIVELLIVIVVIGILAAIVIVAFNGIQNSGKNSKTLSAVNGWVKALRMYEVQNGSLPTHNSCFGKTTTYPDNGLCWDGTSWDVDASFLTAMAPFMGSNQPEPDTSQVDPGGTYPQRRGAFYYGSNTNGAQIYVMQLGTGDCPTISTATLVASTGRHQHPAGIRCIYDLE